MTKSGIFVIIFSVMIGRIASQCGVETCDNYDLLTQDNALGLISTEEVEPLCRIIKQLEMCVNSHIQDCPHEERITFEPAFRSAKVICQNANEYKQAVPCYFNPDVVDIVDICTEELHENEMNCKSIRTYQDCITLDTSLTDYCSTGDIALLGDIITASLHPFLQKYNCLVTTRETTLPSTIKTSSASPSTSSSSSTASSTTESTNNPSGSGPISDGLEAGAASLDKSIVLSVMSLFSASLAMNTAL